MSTDHPGGPSDRPEIASDLVDLRERPPEPLALAPSTLGVWELAWPTIVAVGAQTMVRFVDFAMVGSLGPDALAAVGLGGQVYWLVQSIAMLVPTGLAAILARAIGAGDMPRADAILRQSILLATALALATTFGGLPFTREAIAIYGVEPAVVELGAGYIWWLLVGTVPFALSFVFGAAVRAAGDARTPLYIGIVTNLANVFLNWVLIYGHLGFPAYGVEGAAIASSAAMLLQLAIFWWMWRARSLVLQPGSAGWRPHRKTLRQLVAIGYPASIEQGMFQVGLVGFQRIMSLYGTAAIAAYNVGAQILSLSFIPGVGFATAAATLVGMHLGAGEPDAAARSAWRSTAGAVVSMTLIGALVVLSAEPLARVFTDDEEVIRLTIAFVFILGAVQPFMAVEFAIGGALRGAGDTFFPMVAVFIGLFLLRLLPAVALITFGDFTVEIIWCTLIADWAAKAVMLAARFRRGRWRTLEL